MNRYVAAWRKGSREDCFRSQHLSRPARGHVKSFRPSFGRTGPLTRLRIAIVVHGRFHAFDLARELLHLGQDVVLFTNYPAFVAARFGIPSRRVHSFLAHGIASRLAWKIFPGGLNGTVEKFFNTVFSRWAARQVVADRWDAVIAFSGVAEETFQAIAGRDIVRVLQRGSATYCGAAPDSCRRTGTNRPSNRNAVGLDSKS